MKVTKTKIKDVLIIEPDLFQDDRGWFMENYNKEKFKNAGIEAGFIQDNHSYSKIKGILRGLHFQTNPYSQAKLVRCIRGAVLDVAVDLRKASSTYKQWISVELSAENKKIFFIPRGFAHGFLTLTDDVDFEYKVDNYYNKNSEGRIHFNDPEIGINWGIENPILSKEDSESPFLKNLEIDF